MNFELATAARIIFGMGAAANLPEVVRKFGQHPLLVTGKNTTRAAPLISALQRQRIECSVFSSDGEPTLDVVRQGVRAARGGCDVVVGFGGGSAIDMGKAIAALATNSGEPLDYLEVIGKGQPLERLPLPFIAIPTTAGTGAEVTRNAVIGAPGQGIKASLRSPWMLAKVAVIDPELTIDLPPRLTADTGLDTLTQLIEPFVSSRANAMTDLFCTEGLKRVAGSLRRVFHNGRDRSARESMSFASLLSGLSLSNAGLGVVHGFAAPLGGMLSAAPHGALCAAVLPYGMAMNIRVLRDRASVNNALPKYREVARILTGNNDAEAEDGTAWVSQLCRELAIPALHAHGLKREEIPALVGKAEKASSMKANPISLTPEELTEIVDNAF